MRNESIYQQIKKMYLPIEYNQPLFRPPSEAKSLILQVTIGCSNNECAFCEMYKSKKFTVRKFEEIQKEINKVSALNIPVRKVFLADGDAFVLSSKRLIRIAKEIKEKLPTVQRISAYALPSNINTKTIEELINLKKAGIEMLYVGVESGDDNVLDMVSKGETFNSTKTALLKLKKAGIKASVMILIGLGGGAFSRQHAINSAKLINETQPEFASTLVLTFYAGIEHFKSQFKGSYIEMNTKELLEELRLFIQNLELENAVFRSDHASNYLVLKGKLGADKELFLQQLNEAIKGERKIRPEWMRGL